MKNERGIALLTVITALVALMVIAVPFAITMRMGYERSEHSNARARAKHQVDSVLRFLEAFLVRSTERVEIQNRDAKIDNVDNNDPEEDRIDEFRPTLADIAGTLGVDAEQLQDPYGTILGWQVEDENGKFNINSTSFFALGNLLGLSVLTSELAEGARMIELEDASAFPERGYVKVGRELIRYEGKDGNRLIDCERGVAAALPHNGKVKKHAKDAWVVNYAAFAIAYYRVGRNPGEYTVFDTLDVSDISRLLDDETDIPVITQADWERVLPYITIWSKGEVAGGWSNVQPIPEGTSLPSQEEDADLFNMGNTYQFNTGTIVKIEEKAETNVERDDARAADKKTLRPRRKDYVMAFEAKPVDSRGAEGQMKLFGKVHRKFDGYQANVSYRTRTPVNVNTAPREVLVALFANLQLRTRVNDRVTPAEAGKIADEIIRRRTSENEKDWLRGFEDFEQMLEHLENKTQAISNNDHLAVYRNAMNSHDQGLRFGTAPICFRTFDVYTLRSTATISDRGGRLLAKHEAVRVVEVGSQLTTSRIWETQRDFEEQLIPLNGARYWSTGPNNTGTFVAAQIQPWPRWQKQVRRGLFPWDPYDPEKRQGEDRPFEDQEATETQTALNGNLRLEPARLMLDDAAKDAVFVEHFDRDDFIEGRFATSGYGTPLDGKILNALRDDHVQPFAISFWYQPRAADSGDTAIFDVAESEFRNRYACYKDADQNQLVFAVADNTQINRSCEIRADLGEFGGLTNEVWYHVHLVATGCHPSKMAMIIDGRAVGNSNILSHLTSALGEEGGTISVENASGFPERGVVQVGLELIEYEKKSETEFTVRMDNRSGDIVGRGARGTAAATHPEGVPVVLYGYSRAIMEGLRAGGATLDSALGPFAVVRMDNGLGADDANGPWNDYSPEVIPTSPQTIGGGAAGGPAPPTTGALAMLQGTPPDETQLILHYIPFETAALEWFETDRWGRDNPEGSTVDDRLQAFQQSGFALVAYVGGTAEDFESFVDGGRENVKAVVEFMQYTYDGTGAKGLKLERSNNNFNAKSPPGQEQQNAILVGYEKVGGANPQPRLGVNVVIVPVSVRTTQTNDEDYINPINLDHLNYWLVQVRTEEGVGDITKWEWVRYSELLHIGGNSFFIFARLPNEQLFLDAVFGRGNVDAFLDSLLSDGAGPGADPDGGDPDGGDPDGGGGDDGDGDGSGDPPTAPPADPGNRLDPDDPAGPTDDGPGADEGDSDLDPDNPPEPTDDGPGADEGDSDLDPDDPQEPTDDGSGVDEGDSDLDPENPQEPTDDGEGSDNPIPPDEGGPEMPQPDEGKPEPDPDDGESPADEPDNPPANEGDDENEFFPEGSTQGVADVLRGRGVQGDREETPDGRPNDWWGRGLEGADRQLPVGALAVPCAAVYSGPDPADAEGERGENFKPWPLMGIFDHITLVNGDDTVREGSNLTAFWAMYSTANRLKDKTTLTGRGQEDPFDFASQFGEDLDFLQIFALNRPTDNAYSRSEDVDPRVNGFDLRKFTRVLAFPSGEMLDNTGALTQPRIAGRFNGDNFPAVIDEITGAQGILRFCLMIHNDELAEDDTTINVTSAEGTPATEDVPEGPGFIRVGEELIAFKEAAIVGRTLQFSECVRGLMRTKPRTYQRGAPVDILFGVRIGLLTEGTSEAANTISGLGFQRFPPVCVVRLEDAESGNVELRLFTRNNGTTLTMPIADNGSGLFNGRYGTTAAGFPAGSAVILMPVRSWDRFSEFSDDAELSFFPASAEHHGAYIKRFYWDEGQMPQFTNVRAVIRLNEAIDWNARSQSVIFLSRDGEGRGSGPSAADTRARGQDNPLRFLYAMEDPDGDNMLNLQADKVEIRLFMIYEEGAFDWNNPAINGWKFSPRIESMALEYVQQNRVRRHIDLPK